ncbi:hypothetical protein CspeluHIS016_0703740 [Cutaneotrichosporon spelunceum]|uniref:Uncharacterized protein n=1 Tax=Cutaneotrichosporon spelunceum TaxID=1672016 RepID=A0AAD3TZF0_9TREE|nr:hypothetical protein CspeluHIS016_0703740 [Cutaneotrichosporon spelunceum]
MASDTLPPPSVTRPSSPPISVLSRPPLLPLRTLASDTASFVYGQSISSILSTPGKSTDGDSKRNSRGAPPSAFLRSRYSALPPTLFDGQDKRNSVLDLLNNIDSEWEFVASASVIPHDVSSSPRRNKSRRKPKMSTVDSSRQGGDVQKKPSLFRRLTQSSSSYSSSSSPPVAAPAAPPQLPRLSTLMSDSTAPLAAAPNPTSGPGGLMSGTMFGESPPNTRAPDTNNTHSLPPGAAAPPGMSLPNGSQGTKPGFRVQSRAQDVGTPVHAPHARPNGTPIAMMHRHSNGMFNGGGQALSNGMANTVPSSPPQAPPYKQPTANDYGIPTSPPPPTPPKPLSNSTPMAPPRPLYNGNTTSPRPLATPSANGPYTLGQHPPNGNAVHSANFSPPMSRPGPPPGRQNGLSLPPGAAHRSAPTPALASPPIPSPGAQFKPMDPKGGFPQQVYSRPPLLDIKSPPVPPPAGQFASRNPYAVPSPNLAQNGPQNPATPPMFSRGLRPIPTPPPGSNGHATIAPPTRSTSAQQGPTPSPSGARPLPTEPSQPPSGAWPSATTTASGATVHVIASSNQHREPVVSPSHPVAPPPSSAAPAAVTSHANTAASRPKITIPSPSTLATAPPPQPQSYTGPALAAATAVTNPMAMQAQQPPKGSSLMSRIELTSPTAMLERRDARPETGAPLTQPSGMNAGVGNGIPPVNVLAGNQLPPRTRSSVQERRIAASPLASPAVSTPPSPTKTKHVPASTSTDSRSGSTTSAVSTSTSRFSRDQSGSPAPSVASNPSTARASSVMDRGRPKLSHKVERSMTSLLAHPRITMSLLPHLNINSFLNLLGSDDNLRKYISGEMVGRWVMREWGITIERERGRSWPGLTVWEGFLESLLHDPAVYSTYPGQYHNLLRHLSLSHSLIVLFLRTLPATAFPYAPPLPFDDDLQLPPLNKSSSIGSFHSMGGATRRLGSRPASRTGSYTGSDAGGGMKLARRERVTEVVMPEPLSAGPRESAPALPLKGGKPAQRRGSIGSIASVAPSFKFGRRRSNSMASVQSAAFFAPASSEKPATPVQQGKAAFPPVSYPTAKRYEFRRYGDNSAMSPLGNGTQSGSRPGSIMSVQSGSVAHNNGVMSSSQSFDTLPAPPPIGGSRRGARSSLTSSSSKRSDAGGNGNGSNSPVQRRWDSPTQSMRVELAFERPPPFMTGRAPILRVFVPISDKVPRWPSKEGASLSWRELEKCGASKRMRLGDLVVNTALSRPSNTEHVLVFIPFVQHQLVPLEYVHCTTGHLPHYLDAFALSPTYYDPFLPPPQIIYLDFAPWAHQAMNSVRLAYERRDHTTSSGARISAKRYLHVGGIEVKAGDRVAPEWQGMISLEAEGTAEGRQAMEARFGHGDAARAVMGPWEVVRERSMLGSLWLRLIPENR